MIESVVTALGDKEVGVIGPDGQTTPEASHYATLLDIWSAM